MDLFDQRDIRLSQLKALSDNIEEYVLINQTPFLNQWKSPACTIFWTSSALFEMVAKETRQLWTEYIQPYDPADMWIEAKKRGASDSKWWILQSALALLKDKWYIAWYAAIASTWEAKADEICKTLNAGYTIATGSPNWFWSEIKKTGVYTTQSKASWHIFAIVWYDLKNKVFIAKNSWGDAWGVYKWLFHIPFSYSSKLFSCYAIIDNADLDQMNDYKNESVKKTIEYAISRWITNGERLDDIATNDEIATIINRWIGYSSNATRQEYADLFHSYILRGKMVVKFWNAKDGKSVAKNEEIAIMFLRCITRSETPKNLTRRQVIYSIIRDFIQ
jgi:hypothetical protein